MKNNCAFVSVLTTNDYLPGLLVLNSSLKSVNTKYPFHILLTPDISRETIDILEKNFISYSIIPQTIDNPTDVGTQHRWFPTYSKLAVFNQTQYKKVVYMDVDMLVLRNIDELFNFPHMSATNAGGMLPRKASWTHLNSGLFVLEPFHVLFEDMMNKVGKIENLESGGSVDRPKYGSDQDFLNAYYPDWPKQNNLHLDHKYNLFHYYLDEYHKLFGYTIEDSSHPISVIHYASYLKPWNINEDKLIQLENNPDQHLELKSIKLWIDMYENITP